MNNQEFLSAALASPNCPQNFAELYEEFCGYQKLALDTLKEFHRVCELNSIHYSVSDGTMLGIVREGGQIPWDYDVDVMVPLEDKDAIIEALKKDLDSHYYFVCPEVRKNCRHFFIRVAPKGYRSEFLHVDVFYFIGAPDSEEERMRIAERYKTIINHRYTRYVDINLSSYNSMKRRAVLTMRKLQSFLYPIKKEYDEFHSYAKKYPYKDSAYVLRADQFGWDKRYNKGHFRTFYSEDYLKTQLIKTHQGEFRIFEGYDRILSELYGDYMKGPSIENCIKEVVSELKRLRNSRI